MYNVCQKLQERYKGKVILDVISGNSQTTETFYLIKDVSILWRYDKAYFCFHFKNIKATTHYRDYEQFKHEIQTYFGIYSFWQKFHISPWRRIKLYLLNLFDIFPG